MLGIDLSDRVAIVTGGNQGIERAIALGMAQAGADVVIAARTIEAVEAVCDEVRATGRKALGVRTDVSKADQVAHMVRRTQEEFGRIDILVNNAGGIHGSSFNRGALLEITEQDFDECIAVNLKSVWLCGRAVAPLMMEQQRGAIVNISSISAYPAHGTRTGFAIYGVAKIGVNNLTRSMAAEWGPSIRTNCIIPGFINTPRVAPTRSPEGDVVRLRTVALKRFAEADEIAGAAVFLASDAASYISGAAIDVNGGDKSAIPPLEPVH